jgi:hypothetical protein
MASRLQEFMHFLGPEPCARVDVEDVATFVFLKCMPDVFEDVIYGDTKSDLIGCNYLHVWGSTYRIGEHLRSASVSV